MHAIEILQTAARSVEHINLTMNVVRFTEPQKKCVAEELARVVFDLLPSA
jgi:hypothetical protein